MNLLYLLIPVALLVFSVVLSIVLVKRGTPAKKALAVHFLSVVAIMILTCLLPMGAAAAGDADTAAPETTQSEQAETADSSKGFAYIGAALAVGLAGIGGGIAVAAGAPAAIGATAEDPKSFGKSIIFVALGEGFGLYGLLIAIMILIL
ncbi:MAG TPA: ATP synthase subunit C [Firmicutes bacterium]|nr:ATP synthase subunit C [Bacillota bacterium]HJD23551.1 ATP synthase subunit C [Bacillota bacterium]